DRGGPRWPSHGGRRQRAAMELGRRLWATIADGGRGKKHQEAIGVPSPTLIRAVEQRGGASAVPVAAALGGAGSGARRARRQRAVALRFLGAPGVLLGPLYRQPRRWSGAGGAGERDGTRRRVAGGAVRGSLPLYRVNDGRRRSVSVRGSLGTAACERLERDQRRAGACSGAGQRRGGAERDRAACEGRRTGLGQARCVAGAGSKAACPGGG